MKRRSPVGVCLVAAAAGWMAASCGYRPAAEVLPAVAYCVRGGPVRVADARAVAAAEAGARAALAHEGLLGDCSRDRQLLVDMVEIRSMPAGAVGSGGGVIARGAQVVVTARGVLLDADGAELADVGTVRASATYAHGPEVETEVEARDQASLLAARRAGENLARRALGRPVVSDPRGEAQDVP